VGRMIDAQLAGRGDHSRKLFSLLVLEVWMEASRPVPTS